MNRSNEILFEVAENALLVANGGCPFSRKGVISVCASHLSDKQLDKVTDHFDASDKQLIRAIRCNELDHYKDTNRVTSDSNIEHETVHDYGGRFVWELLQNADDAMGEGRLSDVLIGSKGLGFKAVLEVTDEPEIHSGPFHFLFSSTKTRKLLKKKKLHNNPPILTFRIPHECEPNKRVKELLSAGYKTVVRLPFRDAKTSKTVSDRLRTLDPLFLLLAQELSCVRICAEDVEMIHEITRKGPGLSSGDVILSTCGTNGTALTSWRRWIHSSPASSDQDKQLTVAVCLPLTEQGDAVPHSANLPFHVFFPTEEDSGARALVHASFDLAHNRKRVREGDYDDVICREFCKLFQGVLKGIPARTALETFGKVTCEDKDSPLNNLQKDIWDTLCHTPFVPVIGGDRVSPGDVQLWNDKLGLVLRDDAKEVRDACLLVPELSDIANVLKRFGAKQIENEDYIRLLSYCRNESLKECFASWQVLVKGGLKRIPSRYSRNHEDREDLLERLRAVPCWWTGKEVAQTLNGSLPMTLVLPEDWPDWLPTDSLHPRMRKVIERYETKAKIRDNGETLEIWRDLISGWILKQREEYLHDVLLPFVAKWDSGQWETAGWQVLRRVLSWSPSREFAGVPPLLENPNGTQREKQRTKMAKILCLPTDKGWLPAADCYAGEVWGGPPAFDQFFVSVEDRGLVLPFHRWPNQIRKGTKKDAWKALLRWVGVSWEPKVRRVEGWPDHCLMANYREWFKKDNNWYKWLCDWEIEFFPECIYSTNAGDPASVLRTMLPLVEILKNRKASYYRSRYFYNKNEKHQFSGNFAAYQLRYEEWLPCKPALFHDGKRVVAPRRAFMPDKGLRGLLPEVDRGDIKDEEWFQHINLELRSLGVRVQLPKNPEDWHDWMRKLPKLANGLDNQGQAVSEEDDYRALLQNAAYSLYRKYLKLEWWGELNRWDRYDIDFPAGIDVPCMCWENDTEVLTFSSPDEVFYIDQPHFDEVRQKIASKGFKLFIVRLNAGKDAPKRLGVCRLSYELHAEPCYERIMKSESDRLSQRYKERCLGLVSAANLRKSLPEELNIIAVHGLRLELTSNGKSVTDVEVLSWEREDGSLLINLDKDKWRALGHGLAARIAMAEDKASLFENLLREDYKDVYLDRLRQEGVTEDDIKNAESTWTISTRSTPEPESPQESRTNTEPDLPTEEGLEKKPKDSFSLEERRKKDSEHRESTETIRTESKPPQGSQSGSKPNTETGQKAENWFEEKLKHIFKHVRRHDIDEKNRESDFAVLSGSRKFHIEVKHVENLPGTIYWTENECNKAQDNRNEYFMAILSPNGDGDYKILWIWNPLKELKRASREVQWTGNSGYKSVFSDSWDITKQWPKNNKVPVKRYDFRIRLNDEVIKEFEEDTENLEALCSKIDNLKAEKGI